MQDDVRKEGAESFGHLGSIVRRKVDDAFWDSFNRGLGPLDEAIELLDPGRKDATLQRARVEARQPGASQLDVACRLIAALCVQRDTYFRACERFTRERATCRWLVPEIAGTEAWEL